ncbi:MAG: peptidoglycan-binding domain-containing protein [Alphaproteobacteria bacterium]
MIGRAVLLASFLLASTGLLAADKKGEFFARGEGVETCRAFVTDKAAGSPKYYLYRSWLNGYVSAYNQFVDKTYDITPRADIDGLALLIEAHCKKLPDQPIWTVAFGLLSNFKEHRLQQKSELVTATAGGQTVRVFKETLRAVQLSLKEKGHFAGTPDGVFADKTQVALEAYQKREKLPVTGLPDDVTLLKLFY